MWQWQWWWLCLHQVAGQPSVREEGPGKGGLSNLQSSLPGGGST